MFRFIETLTQEDSEKLIKIHFLWIKSLPSLSPQPRRPNEDQSCRSTVYYSSHFPIKLLRPFSDAIRARREIDIVMIVI